MLDRGVEIRIRRDYRSRAKRWRFKSRVRRDGIMGVVPKGGD